MPLQTFGRGIENKFEPWLWNKINELEANGASQKMSLIIILINNTESLKNFSAVLLVEHHGAEDLWLASILPCITAKVNSTEVKTIAAYDFVKLLGDGERVGGWALDVSTKTVRASYVWTNYDYNGSGKIIAILDSGINETHPGLANKIVNHIDYTGTGYGDSGPYWGHGTHVAGIAAGTGAGSPTGKLYTGVAPGASILNVKVGTEPGPVEQYVVQGIDWAVNNSADIINLSLYLGFGCDCGQCTTCTTIESAVESGVVVVVAAGNFGQLGPGSVTCPGCCEAAITVGATDDLNTVSARDDQLWNLSSRGPVGGRIKPDVVAPSVDIMSPDRNGGYSSFNGTSAATPHVAGVATLILQAHATWSPDMVKQAIKETARLNDQLVWLDPNNNPENDRGKGIVDASRAVPLPGTVIGVGNPSFEERLKSVYEPAYWNWTDVDNDWRELKGDVNGDTIVDVVDSVIVIEAIPSYPGHPKWNPNADLNGDSVVDFSDLVIVFEDWLKQTTPKDGSYSWYTSGNGDYNMTQWLCDHDVNALKGQQVTFSFWFKPNGIGNNATAKITYIIETGSETTISGNWIYATGGWHNPSVTTTLPADTVAIKVVIHFTDNFKTWIDKASIAMS